MEKDGANCVYPEFEIVCNREKCISCKRCIKECANGVSYIIQKGGAAVFTPEGQKQIHDNIAVYKQNAKCIMEVLDKLGMVHGRKERTLYLDEMS